MTEIWERDAWELADAVRRGEVRAVALLDASLERITRLDPGLNAVCHVDADGAQRQAAAVDAAVARGEDPGPLAGVPIGVKELAQAEGFPDTHASVVFRDDVAPADCPEVAGLRGAGAVVTAADDGAGVRDSELHGDSAARRDAQPLEPGADPRRFLRWVGRGGRVGHVAHVHRQ